MKSYVSNIALTKEMIRRKTMKIKNVFCLLLAALIVFSLTACGGDSGKKEANAAGSPTEAQTEKLDAHWYDDDGFVHVNAACTQTLPTLELLTTTSGVYTYCLWDMIYDSLLQDNLDGSYSGRLATEWEMNEDGTEWVFKLLDGVEFSNGSVCDANDVACTMQRYLDKKGTEYNVSGIWALLTGYEIIDDLTIKVTFSEPWGTALAEFAQCQIISDEDYAKYGDDLFTAAHVVGTGKWCVEEFAESQYITLRINENYRDGITTNVEKFTLHFISENSSLVTGLLAGDFDDATRIADDLLVMLEGNEELNLVKWPSTSILMIGLQCGEGSPFHDPDVRKAFYYAIDRQAICDNILIGSTSTAQYLSPDTLGHDDSLVPVYDPEQAKQLLANSSYNGELIELEINSGLPSADDVFTYICDCLSAVGFNATYTKVETAYLGEIRKTGDFTAYAITDNIAIDNGRAIATRFGNPGQHHNLDNDELDAMIAKLGSTVDNEERKALMTEINQTMYAECGPCCPVVCYSYNNCTRAGLQGVLYSPIGGYFYNNIYIG